MLLGITQLAAAQGVVIARATPTAVVDALKVELVPQGFQMIHADEKGALFALDRGMVAQQGTGMTSGMVHIVLEFAVRFKHKERRPSGHGARGGRGQSALPRSVPQAGRVAS